MTGHRFVKDYKVVLVGDDGVGKTSLLLVLGGKGIPRESPVMAPEVRKTVDVNKDRVEIIFWDSACGDGYDEIRKKSYKRTKLFVFCFALNNLRSLENIIKKWIKDTSEFNDRNNTFILGTKGDSKTVPIAGIEFLLGSVPHRGYFEVSSLNNSGLKDLLRRIALIALNPDGYPPRLLRILASDDGDGKDTPRSGGNNAKARSVSCLVI